MSTASQTLHERLAVQEIKIEELTEKVDTLTETLKSVQDSLTHYKGFIGGVLFVFTCVGAFLKFVPTSLGFMQGK